MTANPFVAEVAPERFEPWQIWYVQHGAEAARARTEPPRRGQDGRVAEDFLPELLRQRYVWVRQLWAGDARSPSPLGLCRRKADSVDVVVRRGDRQRAMYRATPEELRGLDHDGLMRTMDEPIYEGSFVYEFYEYCPGGDLRLILSSEHGHEAAAAVLRSVGGALLYLHGLADGLIHRDVKPDNVLRRADGSWALGDLELVTHLGEETGRLVRSNAERGTYAYMAPEQGVSQKYDWYSLGVTLVETLTGQHPFARVLEIDHVPTTWSEVSDAHMRPVTDLLGGLDDAPLADEQRERWRLLLRGLLSRLPDRRWGDDEVRQYLDGGTPDADVDDEPPRPGFGRFSTPDELGAALAQDWDLARGTLESRSRYRDFEGPFLDAVGLWLRDCAWPQQLPRFGEIGTGRRQTNPDVAVAWVLKTLSRSGDRLSIPVPGHQPILADPPGLAGLVTHAQEEGFDATGHYTMAIENLFSTRLLYHLSRDENDPLRLIDAWWQWGFNRHEQLRRWAREQASADRERIRAANQAVFGDPGEHLSMFAQDTWELDEEDGAGESRRARALLLQALADQSTASNLLQAISEQHPEAGALEWFSDLVSGRPIRLSRATRREPPSPPPPPVATARHPVAVMPGRVRQALTRAWNRMPFRRPTRQGQL
jgi:hypothetical protein